MRRKLKSCLKCVLMMDVVFAVGVPQGVNAQVTEEWVLRYYGVKNYDNWSGANAIGSSRNVYLTDIQIQLRKTFKIMVPYIFCLFLSRGSRVSNRTIKHSILNMRKSQVQALNNPIRAREVIK